MLVLEDVGHDAEREGLIDYARGDAAAARFDEDGGGRAIQRTERGRRHVPPELVEEQFVRV